MGDQPEPKRRRHAGVKQGLQALETIKSMAMLKAMERLGSAHHFKNFGQRERIENDRRYDSIWSDPARECWGVAESRPPDHFG